MRISDFDLYSEILQERAGIEIDPEDSFILDSRLKPIAKKWGYPSLSALTMTLRGVPDEEIIEDIVSAVSFGETCFFRDETPFTFFEKSVLPYLLKSKSRKRSKTLRIWSAGCASGQELYSLAIILKKHENELRGWRIEMLGTDLSMEMIEKARNGLYTRFEVQQGLPLKDLITHFEQHKDKQWQAKPYLRKALKFKRLNLVDDIAGLDPFDVIFCRNVFNSFNPETTNKVLKTLTGGLAEDGFLFTGVDEDITRHSEKFISVAPEQGSCAYIRAGQKYKGLKTET